MDKNTYNKFAALVCRLSPENLHCDGECTREEAQQRANQIYTEWEVLETQLGRTVSESEIESIMMGGYQVWW